MKKGQLARKLNKYIQSCGYGVWVRAKVIDMDFVVIDNLPWFVTADNIVQNCPDLVFKSITYVSPSSCKINFEND